MTTSVPPDDNSGNNNRRINVGRVNVERMSVDKSEIKSAEVDILIALSQATMEQTDTIQSSNADIAEQLKKLVEGRGNSASDLQKVIDALDKGFAELIPAINKSAAATDEQTDASGLSAAEMRRTQRVFEAVNKEGETLSDVLLTLQDVEKVLNQNFLEPAREFNAIILRSVSSVTRLNTAIDYATDRFSSSIDLAGAGLVDFRDIYIEPFEKLLHPFSKAGDDLIATGQLIRSSMQEGLVSPLLMIGGNINDVSKSFNTFRKDLDDIEGLDMDAFASFEQQNKMAAEFLQGQRRMGIQDDLNSASMRTAFSTQQKSLQIIAANTGKTVAELSKELAVNAKSFQELQNMGVFTAEQARRLSEIDQGLKERGNVSGSEIIRKIAESRGSVAAFQQLDPATFQMMQLTGTQGLVEELFAAEQAGNSTRIDQILTSMSNAFDEFTKRGEESAFMQIRGGEAGGAFASFRELSAQTKAMGTFNKDQVKKDITRDYYNAFQDFATNTFPLAAGAALLATIANTGALVALTAATWVAAKNMGMGATIGGVAKSGIGMAGGLALRAAKKMIPGAGVIMTAKDAVDAVGGDTSKSNTGALIGSGIGGLLGLPFGPMGVMAGMALGNFAGEMLGSALEDNEAAIPATPAIPGAPALSTSDLISPAASGSSAIGEKTLMVNARQAATLNSINAHLAEGNTINRSIRDKIGLSTGNDVGPKGRDASKSTSGVGIFKGRLGAAD